jgi:hypothetical protein
MENETLNQKKIALAQSEHAPIIIELLKDVASQESMNLIGKTEFETIKNAITFDVKASMISGMVDYLENIRKGALHIIKMP